MKLGFSGTQEGMTEEQTIVTSSIVAVWAVEGIEEFHHGCCIGSDEKFHKMIRLMFGRSIPIHGHPPNRKTKVAKWTMDDADELWFPKDYLARNVDIADVCDRLIATPKEFSMVLRSGTWSTVRYFQNRNKELWVITPDGRLLRPKRGDLY